VSWPAAPVTVVVPATSANLGPGFDSLGLALSLYDTVQAGIRPPGVSVTVTGEGATEAGRPERHLVVRAMRATFSAIGAQPPGIAITCENEVPQGFGLGSSAAAIVAGVLAARALSAADHGVRPADVLADDSVLRLATKIEGHPDNVAACLLGGLTIAWQAQTGLRVARLSTLPELIPVVCVPRMALATNAARKVLPGRVPHAHAAANAARTALLIAALTGTPDLLLAGTEDFLHQPYRAAAMPATANLIEALRAASIPAVVSGAGPSVLALTAGLAGGSPDDVSRIASGSGAAWRVLPLRVDADGARVRAS
jgi:homoserine kinase